MRNKRGSILNKVVIHIILIGIIFAIFLVGTAGKINGRDVKQQILEKQIALLIDSAEAGMSFEIRKDNIDGAVDSVGVGGSRIFIGVDGFLSSKGYSYFSKYGVSVTEYDDKFIVSVR
jgi:hypothetical protein